jgi:hypothetical protein
MQKQAGGALNKKSNSGTSGNGHRSLDMDQTTKTSPGDDAGKGPGLLAGTIASLLFAFVFGICFLTIMDVTRPAGPVVAVSQLVSR